jgi:hypothetical protein
MRGGRLNDPQFHSRQQGTGPFAELLAARFARACRVHGLNTDRLDTLDTTQFVKPRPSSPQQSLF